MLKLESSVLRYDHECSRLFEANTRRWEFVRSSPYPTSTDPQFVALCEECRVSELRVRVAWAQLYVSVWGRS